MNDETGKAPDKKGAHDVIAGGGVLTGLAALVGASCCVLPIALVNFGVSAAVLGDLAALARVKLYFMAAALALIAAGIAAAFWGGRRPRRRTLVLLALACVLTVGAYLLPNYEPQILQWLTHQ